MPQKILIVEDDAINVKFMKVVPTAVSIMDIEITNTESGIKCSSTGYDKEIAARQDTFSLHAAGCDTTASGGGIITYDVVTTYTMTVGSDQVERCNRGKIHVF